MFEYLPLNLQFFAGEEDQESAEPGTESSTEEVQTATTETETTEESGSGEPQGQSDEMNRIYADARRRAEAEAERKYAQKQAELDRQVAEQFKGFVNPETNQPITNAKEYFDAIAAQQRATIREQMTNAGLDASLLERVIEANPAVQEAKRALQEINNEKSEQQLQADREAIVAMDPTLSSVADVDNAPGIHEALEYAISHNVNLADAYKIVNFDRLSTARVDAAKQGAINQAKSKSHLNTAGGSSFEDKSKEIPEKELSVWKRAFPDKSDKELKALYNKV